MRYYEICPPEQDNWRVPASLQTILGFREIDISQVEISKSFPKVPEGFEFNKELLERFLDRFKLKSTYHSPYTNQELHQGTDIFLRNLKDIEDVLVYYDHNKLNASEDKKEDSRLAVFIDYDLGSDLVRVTDSREQPLINIPLSNLFRSIRPKEKDTGFFVEDGYGFYVIN
tara:strand:- start:7768 stop:8280 length:513 start_codon:yes stop_codon:yes gene_type:complete